MWNLIEKYKEIERAKQKNLACYISFCVWGKNPDEADGTKESEKEVMGRDKPIDPLLLRGLYG